jgi:hypothetical protein
MHVPLKFESDILQGIEYPIWLLVAPAAASCDVSADKETNVAADVSNHFELDPFIFGCLKLAGSRGSQQWAK